VPQYEAEVVIGSQKVLLDQRLYEASQLDWEDLSNIHIVAFVDSGF
jgi:hypothetical protein